MKFDGTRLSFLPLRALFFSEEAMKVNSKLGMIDSSTGFFSDVLLISYKKGLASEASSSDASLWMSPMKSFEYM